MNSLFHYNTSFQYSRSNSWFIGNSTAKKVRTARDFGGFFSIVPVLLLEISEYPIFRDFWQKVGHRLWHVHLP